MDALNAIASSNDDRSSEDALRVLGRVADAFDNPSLYRTDKQQLFVTVVTSLSTMESVCPDVSYSGPYGSSFDSSYDEDVELSVWEHTNSYPYTPEQHQSHESKNFSERVFRKDNRTYDVPQMLLTSSPLDRLDRLARMELKKTGWFERTDKWSVVETGLQGIPLPMTPPKTPSKSTGFHVWESWERFSRAKTTLPVSEKQTPRSPRRPETDGRQSLGRRARSHDTSERNQWQGDAIKSSMPMSKHLAVHSRESDSHLVDFATLSYGDAPHANSTTPIRARRLSRTFLPQQIRGRLGQVVHDFVKRMLPPLSGGRTSIHSTGYAWAGHARNVKGACGDSPSERTCEEEMMPRSAASRESVWTFASASSWMEAGAQGCLDYQATNRWSGFWH